MVILSGRPRSTKWFNMTFIIEDAQAEIEKNLLDFNNRIDIY